RDVGSVLPVAGLSYRLTADRSGDPDDRGRSQSPPADRQPGTSIGRAGDREGLDCDEDRHFAGRIVARGRRPELRNIAAYLEAARGADPEIMQQRIFRRLAALPALLEIKGAVEIAVRVAALARSFFQIMH